jgi:hypothetical protein
MTSPDWGIDKQLLLYRHPRACGDPGEHGFPVVAGNDGGGAWIPAFAGMTSVSSHTHCFTPRLAELA